jgi:hypothetical protein
VKTPISDPEPGFSLILRAFAEHEVDCIIVGGVAAVLQGAPINTFDLDVVHSRTPENLTRLLAALQALDATFRDPAGRRIVPEFSHLASPGHQLLKTQGGALDLLGTVGTVGHERGYEELLPHSVEFIVSSLRLRVLELSSIIELKEEAGRDKDLAVLPILRRTLEAQRRIPPEDPPSPPPPPS